MKLIAKTAIVHAPDKTALPGEEFEVSAESAEYLLKNDYAVKAEAPKPKNDKADKGEKTDKGDKGTKAGGKAEGADDTEL